MLPTAQILAESISYRYLILICKKKKRKKNVEKSAFFICNPRTKDKKNNDRKKLETAKITIDLVCCCH